jgi:hypothetical protein
MDEMRSNIAGKSRTFRILPIGSQNVSREQSEQQVPQQVLEQILKQVLKQGFGSEAEDRSALVWPPDPVRLNIVCGVHEY